MSERARKRVRDSEEVDEMESQTEETLNSA